MMNLILSFPVFMYFIGLTVFCFKCKYLPLMLLSLEFIVLSFYFGVYIYLTSYSYVVYVHFRRLSMIFSMPWSSQDLFFTVKSI